MDENRKTVRLYIRVLPEIKKKLMEEAKRQNVTLNDFVCSRIDNSLTHSEINEIRKISDDNIAAQKSVANNINQIARRINYNDSISREEIKIFFEQMQSYALIQKESFERIDKMYDLLVKRLSKIKSI